MELSFLVIDDSELDCFIARKIIEHTDEKLSVKTIQNAQYALETISENTVPDNDLVVVILLDLQMPLMNGFQFVEEFEKFPGEMKKGYKIVVLSSLPPHHCPHPPYYTPFSTLLQSPNFG